MKVLTSLAASVVAVLLIGATFALAGGEDPTSDSNSNDARADRLLVENVSPDLPEQIAAFRRAQNDSDKLPGDSGGALEDLGDARPGEAPLLSRRLNLAGGKHAYVWPERDGVCHSWPSGSGCAPTALLEREGVLIGTTVRYDNTADDVPSVWIAALAADGVEEVEITFENGRTATYEVVDNGVLVTGSSPAVEGTWRKPDGTVSVQRHISG